jgi:hypothetical protein
MECLAMQITASVLFLIALGECLYILWNWKL